MGAQGDGEDVGGLERRVDALARHRFSPLLSYPMAALAILAAAAVRSMLPFQQFPFVLFFPVVFGVALVLGTGPAFLAIVLSFVLGASFLPAAVLVAGGGWRLATVALVYLLLNGLVAVVCGAFRTNARRRGSELDRARALEGALRESEQRFRLISDSAPAPMWVTRMDRKRSFVNRAYLDFLGLSYDEAVDFDWRHALHPDDLPRIAAEQVANEAALKPFTLEARYRDGQGGWRWLRSESQPRWDAEGGHIGFIGVAYDVTVAREAQAALEELNATLEQRVCARTAELEAAQSDLRQSQKLEAVGQLTGGIAHDFNNFLTIIRSSVDFLKRPDLTEARRGRYVQAISDTVERAARLTEQLLAFARRQSLKPATFDVAERIRMMTELIRPVLGERIELDLSGCGEGLLAKADVVQFETAMVNLAVNARDATEGVGRIAIKAHRVEGLPALRGEPSRAGSFIAVRVCDTGPGVPPELAERILEPFFTTKPVGKGTGLGLSQVFGFAKQSGGELEVSPGEHAGAVFTLYLPVGVGAVETTRLPKAVTSFARGRGFRLLVVEDDKTVGQFSTEMLHDLGYATVWALDGDEALRKLSSEAERFDLAFCDVIMPGMNGVELAKAIRARYPDMPVVLTSGYSHVLAEEGIGGFELLRKPYSAATLAMVLEEALAGRSAAAQDQPSRTTRSTAAP